MARDPLSVAYDSRARRALLAAIRSHQHGGTGVTVFLSSPPRAWCAWTRAGQPLEL